MKSFKLEVQITEDDQGRLHSQHAFPSDQDQETAATMSTGGNRQVAQALFVEALRRECFLQAAILSGKKPDFLSLWVSSKEEEKRKLEDGMGEKATEILSASLHLLSSQAAREIMEMLASGK